MDEVAEVDPKRVGFEELDFPHGWHGGERASELLGESPVRFDGDDPRAGAG
jgi:hypothetical protein